MEQPQIRMRKHNTVFIRCLDAFLVHNAARWCCEVLDATLPCTMYIIWEWEERIARACNAFQAFHMLLTLFVTQWSRYLDEETLPLRSLTPFEYLAPDEQIDRVRLLCTLDPFFERERKHARMVA